MPYLTYGEYKEFGFTHLEETKFDELIKKAGDVVDSVTRHFYKFNDIEEDVPFRRNQFKKAVAAQVEYFNEVGSTTTEGINSSPNTFQAGRTMVSNVSRRDEGGAVESKSMVAEDTFMYLRDTGLLYAGIRTW